MTPPISTKELVEDLITRMEKDLSEVSGGREYLQIREDFAEALPIIFSDFLTLTKQLEVAQGALEEISKMRNVKTILGSEMSQERVEPITGIAEEALSTISSSDET